MEQGNDNLIKSIEMLLTNNSALNYIGTPIKLGQLEHGSNETQVNENVQCVFIIYYLLLFIDSDSLIGFS